MNHKIRKIDYQHIGKLFLDTRVASSYTQLVANNAGVPTVYGVTYTWTNIDWAFMFKHVPDMNRSLSTYRVSHEFIDAAPVAADFGINVPTEQTVMNNYATTYLIATNLNNASYAPNAFGVQGTINESACTYGWVSQTAAGTGYNHLIRSSPSKSEFFAINPDQRNSVSVTMYYPTFANIAAGNFPQFAAPPNDTTTWGIHTFTFSLLRDD